MTGDANAAVLGAFDAGATEVLVNNSHWIMRNLLLELMDPRVRVIKGINKPLCMVQGIDNSRPQSSSAITPVPAPSMACSTTRFSARRSRMCCWRVSRSAKQRLNALLCGHYGVPVAFLSGGARRMPGGAERDWGRSPNLCGEGRYRHVHRLLPPSGGDAKRHSPRRCPRPQGDGEDAAAPLPRARRLTGSASNGTRRDDCLYVRAHSNCHEGQSP